MPKVMMIQGVPMAGAYRAPMGRVLGQLGYMPSAGVPTLRQEERRPQPVLGWLPSSRVPTLRQEMHAPHPVDIRLGALRGALGRAGLGSLCDDDGWRAVNALMTGVGTGFTTGASTTQDGQVRTDAGMAAVGSGLTATASAYRELCAAQAAGQGAGDPTEAATLRQQLELERLRRQMEGNFYAQQSAAASNAGGGGEDKTMTYVAIGVGAAALLGVGVMLFGGRRRRRR